MRLTKLIAFAIFAIYFTLGFVTLTHYGINWDEPAHFYRGQTFLNFLLTGKKDFSSLPQFDGKSFVTDFGYEFPATSGGTIRRSMYQYVPFSFYIEDINSRGNHPVFSDIMAAASNFIFFQKLGISPDVHSYNYYSVFLGALLVAATFLWTQKYFGTFAGLIAAVSLSVFPLYWAELHYNIKDVPETVFYGISVFLFAEAIHTLRLRYLVAFSIVGAMAFATKFNILFSIFIFFPWIIYLILTKYINVRTFYIRHKLFLLYFSFIPIIWLMFWIATYPASWFEPRLLLSSFGFYKNLGTAGPDVWELYPLYYVLFSTPVVILFYAAASLVLGKSTLKPKENQVFILVLLWFIVPIVRVMLPKMNIYGGVRQIMEYIPALAIASGIGASRIVILLNGYIVKILKKRKQFNNIAISQLRSVLQLLVIASFLPITIKMVQMHPNEGVYFNWLIGGLDGAEARGIPNAGQTLGNEYRQAALWINKYAEKNAKLAMGYELPSNMAIVWMRPDITYSNDTYSGPLRKGEYVVSNVQVKNRLELYTVRYLERFLNPVYVVEVDDIPLLKVWKNDLEHTKAGYTDEELVLGTTFSSTEQSVDISLAERSLITRIELDIPDPACETLEKFAGKFIINNQNKFPIILPAIYYNVFALFPYRKPFYLLAAEEATSITFNLYNPSPCLTKIKDVRVYKIKNSILPL